MPGRAITRRDALAGGLASAALALPTQSVFAQSGAQPLLRIRDDKPGAPLSPFIYGSNEIGAMDGGPLSAALDRVAGVTFRRLGGNLMTGYNWVSNAAHAGHDWRHSNGAFLLEALQIPKDLWSRPAVIIEAMHQASLDMGAQSLVTLPLGGFVAADFAGPVAAGEAAPSSRFVPVVWNSHTRESDPIDPKTVDIPQLLARLMERYGDAGSARGIAAYALDNEPGLWTQNHPRLFPRKTHIRAFIARSVEVARIVKSIDPRAKIFGPGSWGATEFVNFQNAPDWKDYQRHGSFLAAYLNAFRQASEKDGRRLLDVLDVHWYPYSHRGDLFRTEKPELDQARLDAPRSLIEAGFVEDSWVARALQGGGENALRLPIIPSLQKTIARQFPGTELAITEFNYGGAGSLVSALALADALGAFGAGGVNYAAHWGSLAGWLGQAMLLYRKSDPTSPGFAGNSLPVEKTGLPGVSAYAAARAQGLDLIIINKSESTAAIDVTFASGQKRRLTNVYGFDATHPAVSAFAQMPQSVEKSWRIAQPARSARRYTLV